MSSIKLFLQFMNMSNIKTVSPEKVLTFCLSIINKYTKGRFYKFNLSLANSQNLIKATANVILLSQI